MIVQGNYRTFSWANLKVIILADPEEFLQKVFELILLENDY